MQAATVADLRLPPNRRKQSSGSRRKDSPISASVLERVKSGQDEKSHACWGSEARWRTIVESAPAGIAVSSFEGQLFFINQNLRRILRLSAQEAKVCSALNFYATRRDRQRMLRAVRSKGQVRDLEIQLRRGDGTRFLASITVVKVRRRRRAALLSIVQNITRRRQTESHLEGIRRLLELFASKDSRESYLQAVVELLRARCDCRGVGIRLCEADGRSRYAAWTGLGEKFVRQEECLVLESADCACLRILRGSPRPQDRPFAKSAGSYFCDSILRNGDSGAAVARAPQDAPCSRTGYLSIAHVPIRWRGQLLGAIHLLDEAEGKLPRETVAFLQSVAPLVGEALRRFAIEQSLRESEYRFRSMFENHHHGILLIDSESQRVLEANPAAADFYGHGREQMRGMSLRDLHTPPVETGKTEDHLAAGERPCFSEGLARLADGEVRSVEMHATPLRGQERPQHFAIIHDVTERKFMEKLMLDFSETERQRIGRDLHDSLGGHLTGLAMLAKGLAQRLASRGLDDLTIAEELVTGLKEAIAHTRTIARGLCPAGLGTLGLADALRAYALSVSQLFDVNCKLQTYGAVPPGDEFAAAHLYRIVQEAVTNALRHGKAPSIRICLRPQKDSLLVLVRDNGSGFPIRAEQTAGMGFRTMRYRAGILGGKLQVTSRPGKGTTVSCRIPWLAPCLSRKTEDS